MNYRYIVLRLWRFVQLGVFLVGLFTIANYLQSSLWPVMSSSLRLRTSPPGKFDANVAPGGSKCAPSAYSYDQRPAGAPPKVSALIFYGRKHYVEILMRYMLPQLRRFGGVLERIVFAVRTENHRDLAYLDELVRAYPNELRTIAFDANVSYRRIYSCVPDDEYVFKIDDDLSQDRIEICWRSWCSLTDVVFLCC